MPLRIWTIGAVLALATSACASAPSVSAEASGFVFRPEVIEVEPGTVVAWTNRDRILHTITAGAPEAPSGAFDLVMDGAGTGGSRRFDEPGTYSYFCSRHPFMRGEVRVVR